MASTPGDAGALTTSTVRIREVGPRDGLQVEDPLPVADRLRFIEALAATGVQSIEAVAFVSPKAVPAMADAAAVVAGLPKLSGITWYALVPNLRGAEMAIDAGIDSLSLTMSASEEYSQRNVRMSVDEAVDAVAKVVAIADGRWTDVVVSCCFGSPYEGEIAPADVAGVCRRVMEAGATSLTLADTTGMATPRRIDEVLDLVGTNVGLHLHDTRATALVNAYAAWQRGVRDFDTATGGLGGSPFAKGATGNLATEDLVHLFDDLGVETGIDLSKVLEASALVSELIGRPVPSRLSSAGPRTALV